ncbi:unnamed protein product [Parnassius apollo]|uniref:(apollo) hypothetical protein n=1 Tax=Parnassius apollo TaxID=110799 RepID=A0A8S3Y729_PARAO|nr:unnamed protein product [Parnassius apollo]
MARLILPFIILLSFVVTVFSGENQTKPTPTPTPSTTPPTHTATPSSNPAKGVASKIVEFATAIPKVITSVISTGFQLFDNIFGGF